MTGRVKTRIRQLSRLATGTTHGASHAPRSLMPMRERTTASRTAPVRLRDCVRGRNQPPVILEERRRKERPCSKCPTTSTARSRRRAKPCIAATSQQRRNGPRLSSAHPHRRAPRSAPAGDSVKAEASPAKGAKAQGPDQGAWLHKPLGLAETLDARTDRRSRTPGMREKTQRKAAQSIGQTPTLTRTSP